MRRVYTMRARATSAQVNRHRLIGTMLAFCLHRWYDEITLRDLAAQSGVALQTVITHFGTKEGVFATMLADPRFWAAFSGQRRAAVPDDIPGAVEVLLWDYEYAGDAIKRFVALESRIPSLADIFADGRAEHRAWLERTCPAALVGRSEVARGCQLQFLLSATDVYT